MSTVFRAAGPHDLLALVPALAGFSPERSIMCIAFSGARSVGVLRHDLPRRGRDRAAVVAAIIGTLCRMPGVDAVVPIAYSDRRYTERGGPPERALLALVARRAEEAGFVVRDVLCRARDAWGSLLDPETPPTGHPLAVIDENALAAAALPDGRPGPPEAGATLAERDDELAAEMAAVLDELGDPERVAGVLERLGDEADPVALVEALVGGSGRGAAAALRLAWFVHLADHPAVRDAMMLQFAFGRLVGEAALADVDADADADPHRPADGDERRSVDDLDDLDDLDELLGRLLIGRSTIRPDVDRVERALGMLRLAIPNAPGELRAGPLCIAAWLAWSLGRGSVAGGLLDRARELAPDHTMTQLLSSFVGGGALPEWAFTRSAPCGPTAGGDR